MLPSPDPQSVEPDRISAEQELDAALDVIVGMLLDEQQQVRYPIHTFARQSALAVRHNQKSRFKQGGLRLLAPLGAVARRRR